MRKFHRWQPTTVPCLNSLRGTHSFIDVLYAYNCFILYCGHWSDLNDWIQWFGVVSQYFWLYTQCTRYDHALHDTNLCLYQIKYIDKVQVFFPFYLNDFLENNFDFWFAQGEGQIFNKSIKCSQMDQEMMWNNFYPCAIKMHAVLQG